MPARKRSTRLFPACPSCGSVNSLPIAYGNPGPEMIDEYQQGKIALGGCIVGAENPRWRCRDCNTDWY